MYIYFIENAPFAVFNDLKKEGSRQIGTHFSNAIFAQKITKADLPFLHKLLENGIGHQTISKDVAKFDVAKPLWSTMAEIFNVEIKRDKTGKVKDIFISYKGVANGKPADFDYNLPLALETKISQKVKE